MCYVVIKTTSNFLRLWLSQDQDQCIIEEKTLITPVSHQGLVGIVLVLAVMFLNAFEEYNFF